MMMSMVMQVIAQDASLTIDDASQMIADTKKAALAMFPGKELAYELIWKPRFQRFDEGTLPHYVIAVLERVRRDPGKSPRRWGRDSPTSQASSIWLVSLTPRNGRQTTSGEAIWRTQAGATETPNPAPIKRRMVSQCEASCAMRGWNP